MKFISSFFFSLFLAGSFATVFLPPQAVAQETAPAPAQGLSISPFIFEERLQKGQTIQRQVELYNNSSEVVQVSAITTDFKAQDNSGQPVIVTDKNDGDENYSLASWISVQPVTAILQPQQRSTVQIQLSVPASAEEGGRYGAVLFSYTGGNDNGQGSQIIKQAGTLFFVKVGTAREQGTATRFFADRQFYVRSKVHFDAEFSNQGNVHVAPKGYISIKNMFGTEVSVIQANRDAAIVLPGAFRTFTADWQPRLAFGRYAATLKYIYGDNNLEAVATTVFWVIPVTTLILALAILVVLIVGGWYAVRRYNAYIISRARQTRK